MAARTASGSVRMVIVFRSRRVRARATAVRWTKYRQPASHQPTFDEGTDGKGAVEVIYMSDARNKAERNQTVRMRVGAIVIGIPGPNTFRRRQASSAGRMHRGADV